MPYVLYGIILIALIILVRNIRIVPQAQAYVITRLGAYKTTWGVGLHLKIPFIEAVAKRLSLKEQVADFPPQPVITKDNVTMQIDTVVYYQITDPKLYTYGVNAERMVSGAITGGMKQKLIEHFDTHEDLAHMLKMRARPGDVILFKGSRGMRMEKALALFFKEEEE